MKYIKVKSSRHLSTCPTHFYDIHLFYWVIIILITVKRQQELGVRVWVGVTVTLQRRDVCCITSDPPTTSLSAASRVLYTISSSPSCHVCMLYVSVLMVYMYILVCVWYIISFHLVIIYTYINIHINIYIYKYIKINIYK